ncbi:MAG: hypothetical protein IJ938_00410 [Clostridia bacterium]|nr:hypothetical protein [Clostridia bacterium]MBR2070816.1 hypothetical protein [Clostridia bacterium]MBR2159754.1 hypothetical protein [Clostridia bacterium]MBR2323996.1 hypothetical protein [Clostridia bacterium]MBR2397974.1 hypothetical protein [Clostridia bacterium]
MIFAIIGNQIAKKYKENAEIYLEYVNFLREYSIAVDITKRAKSDVLSEFTKLKNALEGDKSLEQSITKAISFIKNLGKDNTQLESKTVQGEYLRAQNFLAIYEEEMQKKSKCAIAISIAIGLTIVILIV